MWHGVTRLERSSWHIVHFLLSLYLIYNFLPFVDGFGTLNFLIIVLMLTARRQLTLTLSFSPWKKKSKLEDNFANAANMAGSIARLKQVLKSELAALKDDLSSYITMVCLKIDFITGEQREQMKIINSRAWWLDTFEQRLVDLQDLSRCNNLRLLGLPEGAEKDNSVGFLKQSLSVWSPSFYSIGRVKLKSSSYLLQFFQHKKTQSVYLQFSLRCKQRSYSMQI